MNAIKKIGIIFAFLVMAVSAVAQDQNKAGKPVIVLVHGAWHGGWCWKEVSEILRNEGCIVYSPTLSGLGEHKNNAGENINLDTHIDDIINLIEMEDLHNVILVGHSYAGAVIAGVADAIPARLKNLIFLDAMIVHNGESALSLQPKKIQQIQQENVTRKENFKPFPVDLFGVSDPAVAKWVSERLTPQPFNTFAQSLKLKHEYGNGIPLTYIACTKPQLPIMAEMSLQVQKDKKWKHFSLATGHDAMITAAKDLSALLIEINE